MVALNVSAVLVTRGDVSLYQVLASIPDEWEIIIWDNSFGGQVVRWSKADGPPKEGVLQRESEVLVLKTAGDLAVYGRYAAIEHASGDLIYVQDDDVIVSDPQAIVGEWREWHGFGIPHGHVACNMPPEFRHDFYSDHCLVGFGAVFHRDLPARAFDRFEESPLSGTTYLEKALPFKRERVGNVIVQSNSPHRKNYVLNEEFWRTCDVVFTGLTPRVLVDVPYENLPWAEDETRMYKQNGHVAERTRMLELVRKVRDA